MEWRYVLFFTASFGQLSLSHPGIIYTYVVCLWNNYITLHGPTLWWFWTSNFVGNRLICISYKKVRLLTCKYRRNQTFVIIFLKYGFFFHNCQRAKQICGNCLLDSAIFPILQSYHMKIDDLPTTEESLWIVFQLSMP